jgi:hypothetical protein
MPSSPPFLITTSLFLTILHCSDRIKGALSGLAAVEGGLKAEQHEPISNPVSVADGRGERGVGKDQ